MNVTFLKDLSFNELVNLQWAVNVELRKKDPVQAAHDKAMAEAQAEWSARAKIKEEIKEDYKERVVPALKKVLKPGDMLKMKGCKDGKGIREFIRWDNNDLLVCWQISVRRQWVKAGMGDAGHYETIHTNTNQVTTHMPDKVSKVWFGISKEKSIRDLVS